MPAHLLLKEPSLSLSGVQVSSGPQLTIRLVYRSCLDIYGIASCALDIYEMASCALDIYGIASSVLDMIVAYSDKDFYEDFES